jgi:hypothetical protein
MGGYAGVSNPSQWRGIFVEIEPEYVIFPGKFNIKISLACRNPVFLL